MTQFECPEWTQALSVGNDAIDSEHREFLDTVALVSNLIEGGSPYEIKAATGAMLALLRDHFRNEERLFFATAYPKAMQHSVEHRVLLFMATDAKKMIDSSNERVYLRMALGTLTQLVVDHLMQSDMGYRTYLLSDQNAEGQAASISSEGAKKAAPVTG